MTDRELIKEARDLIVMCSFLDKSGQCNEMADKMDKQLSIPVVVESKPSTKAALNASVSAIYFADNSDYKSYHYEVIRSLTKLDEPTDEDITKLFKELNPE